MRRTLGICKIAWMRFGNCPDSPLPVLPQSDDGGNNWNCRFSTLQGRTGSVFSCEAGTIAFVKRTRSQPRQRGCSRGLGCYPNKQRNRHLAATPDVCFEHLWEQMHCLPSSAPRKILCLHGFVLWQATTWWERFGGDPGWAYRRRTGRKPRARVVLAAALGF